MHELALCQGILDVLEEQAQRHNFRRVRRVRLEIGDLSAVEPRALAFGFEAVTRGTLADGAALEIERVPGQAHCLTCETVVNLPARADPCPRCGGYRLLVTAGEAMRIKDMEVD